MDALADKIMVMGLVIAFVGAAAPGASGRCSRSSPSCREFLVTGMRMVAASKGVIVAADNGGKSKTITQLIALGFLLAAPMVGRDWARLAGADLGRAAAVVQQIGQWIFFLGTALAVWSGWRYVTQFKDVVFAGADR